MASIRRFHPGVYIKDALDAIEMTSKEFSIRTGISERTLSGIINGNTSLSFEVAYQLSLFFDNSLDYWTNLQNQYDLYLREQEEIKQIDNDFNLIKGMKKYLQSLKYIDENDNKEVVVQKIRKIVGVNNLELLNKKDLLVCFKEQQTKNEANYFAQNFWVALALNEARKKNGVQYRKDYLLKHISEIRTMSMLDLEVFYPRLKEIFDKSGISFVLLPYLSKSNIYGATKWFSKDNVMLAVSNRGEKADLFWFTIFHEISHVLMEHRRETLFNIKGIEDTEADLMAANMLIPKDEWEAFIKKNYFTIQTITDFANRIQVHPCIVLGRLHKEKERQVPYGRFDKELSISYGISLD